jgi:hypothetical protein
MKNIVHMRQCKPRKNISPYVKIARRNMKELLKNISTQELLENLKSYNKTYQSEESLYLIVWKSTMNIQNFLKFMLASGVKNFTFTVTDEEFALITEYEKKIAFIKAH